jgi:hypothetical protein
MMSIMAGIADPTLTPLALAGLEPGDERVYRRLLRASGTSRRHISEVIGLTGPELDAVLERFIAAGLVYLVDDEVRAEPPLQALGRVAQAETARHRDEHQVVEAQRNLIPGFVLDHSASQRHGGEAEVNVRRGHRRRRRADPCPDRETNGTPRFRLTSAPPVSMDIDPVVWESARLRAFALYPASAQRPRRFDERAVR